MDHTHKPQNVIILTDFKTGIGYLYVTSMEVIYLAHKLRESGFIPLLYSNFSYNNKHIGNIQFNEIYSGIGFEPFESIHDVNICSLYLSELEGLPLKKKGDHFLVFSNHHDLPQIIIPRFNAYHGKRINFPYTYPSFVDEVYKRKEEFLKNKPEFDFIQFRTRNAIIGFGGPYFEMYYKESHACSRIVTQKLYEMVANSPKHFYIGSNDRFFINELKELPNVFYYNFKNLDLFHNDMEDYTEKTEFSRDIYLDRLYDNLAEFTSISNAQHYYNFTAMRWISNFMSYGLSHNKNNFTLYQVLEDGNLIIV